jgi:hypothetical protein
MNGPPGPRLFGVAVAMASRFHRPLLVRFHDDLIQECHLLAWEAQMRRYVTVNEEWFQHQTLRQLSTCWSQGLHESMSQGSLSLGRTIARRLYG